jgi:iron complex outermembrane receptor protein
MQYRLSVIISAPLLAFPFVNASADGRKPCDAAPESTSVSRGAHYTARHGGKRGTLRAAVANAGHKNSCSTAGNGLLGVGAPHPLKLIAKVAL